MQIYLWFLQENHVKFYNLWNREFKRKNMESFNSLDNLITQTNLFIAWSNIPREHAIEEVSEIASLEVKIFYVE